MRKFRQCVVGGTNYCGLQYEKPEDAKAEAEALARAFKGHKVYVLEAVSCCQLDELPVKWEG